MHSSADKFHDRRRSAARRTAAVAALTGLAATFLATATSGRADTLRADWEHDWVALTVARNGTWGSAVHGNLTRAMIQAIRDCSGKSGATGNDCGAEITTVRASWSLAYACGDYTFIANGDTSAEARTAAIHRAIDLKEIVGLDLPPCTLLVGVDPDGRTPAPGTLNEILPLIGPSR